MLYYGKPLLIVLCLCLLFFYSSALASTNITPHAKARICIKTLVLHGETAFFNTRIGNFEKLIIKELTRKYSYAHTFLVVLENQNHAEAFNDTIDYLNYCTRYKSKRGFVFSLEPIESINSKLFAELLEQGFTEDAKIFIVHMKYQNNFQHNKEQK